MAKKKNKGNKISVNMTGVEGKGRLVAEGDYAVTVEEVTNEESSSGNPYLSWTLKVEDGEFKGSKLWHTTSLQPQALFNLRNTLEALGMEVPDGSLSLDLDELSGLSMGVSVEHETYQGKKKARVVDVYSLDDADGGEEGYTQEELEEKEDDELVEIAGELEVEVPYSGKGKKKKLDRDALIEAILEAQSESDDGDDGDDSGEEDDDEDLSELSDDELVEKAEELDVEPVYTGKGKKKKLDRDATIAAIQEASDDGEEDSEGESDEEDFSELSDDELIDKAKELDVDVVWSNKKKKKLDREATIAALEEAAGSDDDDDEITEESLSELDDEDLIEKAEENEVDPVYKGKGSKKKLDRDATIAAILEALDV